MGPRSDWDVTKAFTVFDHQDSGCLSWGQERGGQRWFVKTAQTLQARASLTRAAAFHAAVRHEAIVAPATVFDGMDGVTVVYPWREGQVLNASTAEGSDRGGLARFQTLPLEVALRSVDTILDAHLAVAAAGWVVSDLYDGCFLYDHDSDRMSLVDLDEYRPGPFVLASDRLPGSERYMAPEEFRSGALIDHCTSVHALGRTAEQLLGGEGGWRGSAQQRAVIQRATAPDPRQRFEHVPTFVAAWRAATLGGPGGHSLGLRA